MKRLNSKLFEKFEDKSISGLDTFKGGVSCAINGNSYASDWSTAETGSNACQNDDASGGATDKCAIGTPTSFGGMISSGGGGSFNFGG